MSISERILAKDVTQNNNSKETLLNNNDLIIGPSGAGKTSGYVIPNLLYSEESKIVVDTKSTLYAQYGDELMENGYKVMLLDFDNQEQSIGYNPFEFIGYDPVNQRYNDQDILTISRALVPSSNTRDPFWENSARGLLSAIIALSLEVYGNGPKTLNHILDIFSEIGTPEYNQRFMEAYEMNEDSLAYRLHLLTDKVKDASTTKSCIHSTLSERLLNLSSPTINGILSKETRINFSKLGEEKAVLFVSVSDTDRSKDMLFDLFYTQAIQQLCKEADTSDNKALEVPVRIILDDFAANTTIDGFDKITSVIRSRNLSVSVILQSMTQLVGMYGEASATTIMNNCDHWLYLGGQDYNTANIVARRMNRPVTDVLDMPLDEAILFKRGSKGQMVERYNIYEEGPRKELRSKKQRKKLNKQLAVIMENVELEESRDLE